MRGPEAPGSIVAAGTALLGEDIGAWQDGRVFRFYLRKDMKWNALAFHLPGNNGTGGVERIELQKWKLLSFSKTGTEIVPSADRPNEYVFDSQNFGRIGIAVGKMPLGLAFLEIVVLGISCWSARRHRPEPWKVLFPSVLSVALSLTLLMHVALPIQSYWANQSSYPFSSGAFLNAVSIHFVWASILAVVALGFLSRCFGRGVLGMGLACAVCIYLESGFLAIGLPSLDGSWWVFQNPSRAMWDGVAWLAVFGIMAVLHTVLKKHYGLVACALSVLVGASMFDARREEKPDSTSLIVENFVPCQAVTRSVRYSPTRNVLIFILDSFEREHAHAVMEDPEDGPKLRQQFEGFTEYVDNIGALPQTLLAVPNLLTGRYPNPEQSMADYCWSIYSECSALKAFLDANHEIFLTTPALGCGYASWQNDDAEAPVSSKSSVLSSWGHSAQIWPLSDVCRWRGLPFFAKAPYAFFMGLEGESFSEAREWIVFSQMQQININSNSFGTFALLHTEGLHVPVLYNRKGELSPKEETYDQSHVEQGIFILRNLGTLFDAYRKAGIYDSSMILVMGDHGRQGTVQALLEASIGDLPHNARPFLWVKPFNSKHEFLASHLPTSHAKIAELLRSSATENLSEEQIQGILQSDKRIYRRMALFGGGWKEWVVNPDGSFSFSEGGDDGPLHGQPLECGTRYSLSQNNVARNKVGLWFTNVEVIGFPTLKVQEGWMRIRFLVPDAKKQYVLKLDTTAEGQGALLVRCFPNDWETVLTGGARPIVIKGVVPDESGLATLDLQLDAETKSDIAFTSLSLLEEK